MQRRTCSRRPHPRIEKKKRLASSASCTQIAAGAVGSAGLLLAAQALYVVAVTPRLPPPDNSGHDFEEDGLVVDFSGEYESDTESEIDEETFNLVLLGDSPVEGIGNDTHCTAMGGKTALAFSEVLRRPVRYWSYGKSGLTAEGIEMEMSPLLRRAAIKYRIDAVIVSCGVNNVLQGYSASQFGAEVNDLISSVEECCNAGARARARASIHHHTRIMMLELIDFKFLPFLPWPFSKVCSWRSQELQKQMEQVVEYRQGQNPAIQMAKLPDIKGLLNDTSNHLLDYMTKEEKERLKLSDFYSDDNFHPAGHGTIVLGKILAQRYMSSVRVHQAAK